MIKYFTAKSNPGNRSLFSGLARLPEYAGSAINRRCFKLSRFCYLTPETFRVGS